MAEPCGRSPRFASALTGLILVVAFASVAQAAEPRWSRVTSPARTFTVELPEGWVIKPSEPDESWVTFAAPASPGYGCHEVPAPR